MTDLFTQWVDNPPPTKPPANQGCDHPGCCESGAYRAPKSRQQIVRQKNEWLWFCLAHIRVYNASWNYYQGMNEEQITKDRYADVTWQRPTWPLNARRTKKPPHQWEEEMDDPFDLFVDSKNGYQKPKAVITQETNSALNLFNLGFPFSKEELQKAYRQLVKKHHPDCNQNDVNANEKIRQITETYRLLQKMIHSAQG